VKRAFAWAAVLLGIGLLSGFLVRLLWPRPLDR